MTFLEKLEATYRANTSPFMVGLDPVRERIPDHVRSSSQPFFDFCRAIVDATHDLVIGYKPNAAFFECIGDQGVRELRDLIRYIHGTYPGLPVVVDAKRGDIGSSNESYAEYLYGYLDADAVTVHPYLGAESLAPFLSRRDKGIFILCRTSNPGAREFQDLSVSSAGESLPLYQFIASTVVRTWNTKGNCGLVVGATYPEELKIIRSIAPELPILVPGIGAQGGELSQVLSSGQSAKPERLVITVGRSVIYAGSGMDFASDARSGVEVLIGQARRYHDQ